MELKDIRVSSTEDLNKKVVELKHEIFSLRFQQASGQLAATGKMRVNRKIIARIKTIIRERENSK